LSLLVSQFLMFESTGLLLLFPLEPLSRRMLFQLIFYLLLFLLFQLLLSLFPPLIIVLYPRYRYYLHHLLLVMLSIRYYPIFFVTHLYLVCHPVQYSIYFSFIFLLLSILNFLSHFHFFHFQSND